MVNDDVDIVTDCDGVMMSLVTRATSLLWLEETTLLLVYYSIGKHTQVGVSLYR